MAADPTSRTQLTPLVGRQAELRLLVDLLANAGAGSGTIVLLGGEAGIGKTRLCREVKREAATREMRVIEGRCTSTRRSVAYGPFLDAIKFRIGRGERDATAGTLAPILAYLAPLFPELGSAEGHVGAPVSQERAFEVITGVFQRLASLGPLLLILEDLHWADPTSLELLQYLTPRIETVPILVLATYRSDEIPTGHGMRQLLVRLTQERIGHRMHLSPLGRTEMAEMARNLVGRQPDAGTLATLWGRAEGNPFFLEELLGASSEASELAAELGAPSELPLTLRDAVHARVDRLTRTAAEVLGIAAVIGRRFSYGLLVAVSGRPGEELFTALAELLDHQLLVEEHAPDEERYCFRHVLTREVLYADIIGPKRRWWHARIAAALADETGPAEATNHEEIAHHYRLSGDHVRARHHDVLAGDGAARLYAWSAAESHYQRALSTIDRGTPDPPLHAAILEKLATVVSWQRRPADAVRYAEEAVAVGRRGAARPRTAALLRRLALLEARYATDRTRAHRHLEEAVRLLAREPESVEHARVANDMGHLLAPESPSEAEPWLARGLEIARRAGDEAEIAFALAESGRTAVLGARVTYGLERLHEARRMLREEEFPIERATAIYWAALAAMSALGDHDAAREWLEAASTYAVGHGMIAEVALCRSYEAWIDQDVGVSAEAIERARAAVVELRRHGSERAEALRLLGELHHLRGDPEAALKCFSEAVALGARHAALGRSRVLLAAGRPEEAVEDLRTALSGLGPGHQLLVLRALPVLVEALARAGRTDAAAEALARLEAETAGADDPFSRVAVRQASAVVHAARGELEAAERALNEAVVGWASLTRRLDRLRAVVQLGELLLATSSERARATALMESALRELEALGAAGDAKRARSLLQRHGHRPPPARSPAVAKASHGLTGREREVLQQLVKGSTNKEIARALAMSERTASVHVSHLLRKLRCATRTQAVSYAISQGIVQLSLALAAVRWVGGLLRGR